MITRDQAETRLKNYFKDPSYRERKEALIDEIATAFNGVERGDGVTLHEAWVIDNYGSDEDRAEARKKDVDTKWQDIPDRHMLRGNSVLSFLDPLGFRYYIPAYMCWSLRFMDSEDPEEQSDTFGSLIYALTLDTRGEMTEYHMSRYSLFNAEQAKAIAHFLSFDAEHAEEYNIWGEALRVEMLTKDGYSLKYIRELKIKAHEEYGVPENDAQHALNSYWGRFL